MACPGLSTDSYTFYVAHSSQAKYQINGPYSRKVRPGIHYPHVTWAHVMLRMQLGCERRFNIEFYGADSHFSHAAYVTWYHVELWPLTCQHASHNSVVAHISWDVIYVSSALQTSLSVVYRKSYCLCRRLHRNRYDWNSISPDCLAPKAHMR